MQELLLTASVLLIAGCATTQSFVSSMDQYKGKPAASLIKEFGAADERIEQDGQTTLVFRPIKMSIPIPIIVPSYGMRVSDITPRANAGYEVRASCRVAFILKNDQVIDWYSQGKECPNR